MKFSHRQIFLAIVLALVSLGFVCKNTAQNPSSISNQEGTTVPADWKEYRNNEWNVRLAIPSGWEYRMRSKEEIGGQDILWVDFNRGTVVFKEAADVVYPLGLTVSKQNLQEELDAIQNKLSQTEVVLGGKSFTKVAYKDTLSDSVFIVYFFVSEGRVYAIDGDASLTDLEQIVSTLEVK